MSRTSMSRRNFVLLSAAAGMVSSLALSDRASAAPKRGGSLRAGLAHGSTTDILDPAQCDNGFTQTLAYALFNGLTEASASGDLAPGLAESWEPSADARTWHFKIRQGVTFHNGKTLGTADILASLNRHRSPDSTSGAKGIVEQIEDIKADGPDGVTFVLKSGNADFPYVLSDFHLGILPSTDGKVDSTFAIGCGSYELVKFVPGIQAQLRRNPNDWNSERGFFDDVQLLTILDASARTSALISGDIDVMSNCDLKTVKQLGSNPRIRVEQTSGTQHYSFDMFTDQAPYDSNDVRMALKYAVDRKEMIDKILNGYGYEGNDHPIGKSDRFFAADLEQRSYDADKAKYHLKKAGISELKVSLSCADAAFAGGVDAGQVYSESAKKAGITLKVIREPNDGYWSDIWLKKPWVEVYWGGRPTADWTFTTAYAAGVPWNDTHWNNERFNALLVQARGELDDDKRRGMYAEMQKLVRDDGGAVIPMFANYVFATSDKIAHPEKMGSDWDMDGLKFFERWWFV
ncbi:ABC transporter substrate-binding protein [Hypericibacter sp.]|uniref:ABC transporter substrate-binding protein n=1 Tax=Hypericibacter sp. TaxID=2705401 RepID=UPI003D6D0AA5